MRYLSLHGHFYQPPRENPWLSVVLTDPSAYPYHDWNERINRECYLPNAYSRIFDNRGRILRIVNNYRLMNFDFGPTLINWLVLNAPDVYRKIVDADRESIKRVGYGNAIAQAYNHIIMPLAKRIDKKTQIIWGIRDFQFHFGRNPLGIWFPETAVDLESLDLAAEAGIRFTILAPHQAKEAPDGAGPYRAKLPSGREMGVFFYNADISFDIAFGGLLADGETFYARLVHEMERSPLVVLATDGETFGHHHKFGELALSYVIERILQRRGYRATNLTERFFNSERMDIEVRENTSWSCAHGVERWRSDCGCTTNPRFNQTWRRPLREAMDWLKDNLDRVFEEVGQEVFLNPWSARDDYIEVMLDRKKKMGFLRRHLKGYNNREILALKLLEMQRAGLYMFTSCGWFFDDISRIESQIVMAHAARAMELAKKIKDEDLLGDYLEILSQAQSNIKALGTGADIFRRMMRENHFDLQDIGATFLISKPTETSDEDFYNHHIEIQGKEISITSLSTSESVILEFKVRGDSLDRWCRIGKETLKTYSIDDIIPEERYRLMRDYRDTLEEEMLQRISELRDRLSVIKDETLLTDTLRELLRIHLRQQISSALRAEKIDPLRIFTLVRELKKTKRPLDRRFLAKEFKGALLRKLLSTMEDKLQDIKELLKVSQKLSIQPDLWECQNAYYNLMLRGGLPEDKELLRLLGFSDDFKCH